MNISEPVEKSVLSAKAKDILLNKGIVTIGELFSAKGKQFSEIINENSDIAKELEGFIRRNAEQAERAGISIDYDLWLFANEKYVHMYAKENDIGIGKLGLSADTYNYLAMYAINMFSNLVGMTEYDFLKNYRIPPENINEILRTVKNRLYERKSEIIGFVDKIKRSETEKEFKKSDEIEEMHTPLGNKMNIRLFAKFVFQNCDSEVKQLALSVRASNCLIRNGIRTLSDMILIYPDGYDNMRSAGTKTVDEIKQTVENTYRQYERSYRSLENMSPEILPTENETGNLSLNNLFADYIAANHEVSIDMLDLSVRTYNCLRRNNIMTLSKLILAYPDDIKNMANFGRKSFEEIEKLISDLHDRYDEHFLNSENDANGSSTNIICSMTVHELLSSNKYRPLIKEFFEHLNIRLNNSGLSGKAVRYLGRTGMKEFTELFELYPDRINSVAGSSNAVGNELKKYIENTVDNYRTSINSYCCGDEQALYTDKFIRSGIMNAYNNAGFSGKSYEELRAVMPDAVDEKRIKKAIAQLIKERKLEYVDFRCYKVYPSYQSYLREFLESLEENQRVMLCRRINGDTLEQIASDNGITRERVRQITGKLMKLMKQSYAAKTGNKYFDEDYYAYLYRNYDVPEAFGTEYLCLSKAVCNYLGNPYGSSGKKPFGYALKDEQVPVSLRYRIRDFEERDKIKIDGKIFDNHRSDIEDYALEKICREEITFDNFVEQYNALLKENDVPLETKLYYIDTNLGARRNKYSNSRKCLWKYGSKMRYYDIDSIDYKELLDTLALDRFSNTEISTLKFFNDFPELMNKYDIRDQYELHNLLKKICNKENYSNISFEKQPSINFGTFDFDKELDLLVRMLSPVSQKELIDYIYLEYGFEKNTTASKLSVISKYCHNGVYNVDYKKMPENRLQIMKNNLNEPFYYFDEVKDKYSLLFANADRDEINPYTLKKMGFHVLSKYILSEKYESLREYFIDLLTKNDVIKISDFTRRYTNVQMYYQTLSELKKSYKIIQADADTYISFRKLEEKGIALDDIHEFCNKVYATVNDGEYFTIHSIRSYGFTDIFENAGFGEYLCSALLACDSRFDSQSIFLSIVLSKNNEIGQISKKSFIKSCLSENVPCSPKKLIESVYNKYGVRITDKYEITEAIKNSNFCYDDIIDEIYAIE